MPDPRPKNEFAPRVQVVSPTGEHVFTVHAEEAANMVRAGKARKTREGRRVAVIALTRSLANEERSPCSRPSIRQFMGQSYTYRRALKEGDEIVAYTTEFKYIDPRDRAIFLLSVTDCMKQAAA
jgi:hypothetical protein